MSDLLHKSAHALVDLECAMRDIVSLPLEALFYTIVGSCALHIPFGSSAAYASFAFVWQGVQIP